MSAVQNRKTNYLHVFICFSGPWLLYFLLLLLGKSIYYYKDTFGESWLKILRSPWFWCDFLPAGFFFVIGVLINRFADESKPFSPRRFILAVSLLAGIELAVQFLMGKYQDQINISFMDEWLTILPLNVFQQIEGYVSWGPVDRSILIPLLVLGAMLYFLALRLTYFLSRKKALLSVSAVFFAAGIFCAILFRAVYKEAYDYIKIVPLAWFNIMDIYVYFGLSSFLLLVMQSWRVAKKGNWKDIVQYGRWEYGNLRLVFDTQRKKRSTTEG
ncbi:MAG: hypothetical protein LBG76_04990 [Treponema sp.]|nr:hypothetical protein [Treponema sp.]